MPAGGSTGVVRLAFAAHLAIALAKFAAAAWTGSSAMLSEAIHSLVATSNQGLLLLGLERARRTPASDHPLGYAPDIYFWSYVAAVLLYAMGAGVAIYDGVHKVMEPQPIASPHVAYAVLGPAFALVALTTWTAAGEVERRYARRSMLGAPRRSKDAALFTVVLENIAALVGLVLALAGVAAAHLAGLGSADGAASIAIGILLASVAAVMSIEVRAVIVGGAGDGAVCGAGDAPRDATAAAVVGEATARPIPSAPATAPPVPASAPPASAGPASAVTSCATIPAAAAAKPAQPVQPAQAARGKHKKGRPRPR